MHEVMHAIKALQNTKFQTCSKYQNITINGALLSINNVQGWFLTMKFWNQNRENKERSFEIGGDTK